MAKNLYLAPAASGKSGFVLDLARSTAASLQAEVRICVPTSLQAHAWQKRLADAGGAIGIHVLTFDKLVAACLNEAGESYTQLSDPVLYRLLRTIIDQLPLTHYAPIKEKPGFIQVAKRVINELKSGLVDPPAFLAAIQQLGNESRLAELAEIYIAYQAQLQNKGWADRVGLHWLAVEALKDRAPDCCRAWQLLIFDGFDDFTPSQLALLALLAGRVDDFLITLPHVEGVDFQRYQDTRREIEEALGLPTQPFLNAKRPDVHPALTYLAGHVFSLSAPGRQQGDGAVTLMEAADRVTEARTALRWLKKRIILDELEPDQVVLLARNITPYRAFVQQIAAEFGLPIRLVDGVPLRNNPVIASVLELLRLFLPAAPGGEVILPRRQVIAAWRSPYFRWKNEDLAITAADADRLDKFGRDQRIIRGLSQWQAAFSAGISARERAEIEVEEGEGESLAGTAVQTLEEKFDYFIDVTQPPVGKGTMQEFVAWLERLIGPDPKAPGGAAAPEKSLHIAAQARANSETGANDIAALRTLKDILRGLVWAEESVAGSPEVDYTIFFKELSGAIAATQLFLPARPDQKEILVASSPQVRGLSFTAVAVMGLSEGSFPASISEDPFLRDQDRGRLRDQFGFDLELSTQSAEREYFYEAITRPRQKLLLTRPVLAENGAEWVASPFWEEVQQLIDVSVQQVPSEGLLPLVETASQAEWWESFAGLEKSWQDAGGTKDASDAEVWAHIDTAARIWQERADFEPSIWDGALDSLTGDLALRYGPDRIWSATRLEAYQTCGFLFFSQNVLKLSPRPEPAEGLDTRQLGSLYHNIFEKVTQAPGLDPSDEGQVRTAVSELAGPILDAAPEKEGFRETPWWENTRREIIDNVVNSVLILADGEFEFFQAERRFGIHEPPLVISDNSDQLMLRGFIDRLDRTKDGRIRIVDYKLGGPATYNPAVFRDGKKLQLPLYALAAQDALQLGEVADGFYWHFRSAEPSKFQLHKVDGGVEGAIETAVSYAWEAVHKIRGGQFTPQPPNGGCPGYCPAAAFCWQYTPRNY